MQLADAFQLYILDKFSFSCSYCVWDVVAELLLVQLSSVTMSALCILIWFFYLLKIPVAKETEFEFWGFVFVMLAAVMSGFRWCMTQILLQV